MNSLFESEHLSGELEAAMEAVAARIPADVYERLGAHRYPVKRRPLRRAALVGAPIAAVSAVVAVLVTGFGPTTQIAFAGWTATPTTPTPGRLCQPRCHPLVQAASKRHEGDANQDPPRVWQPPRDARRHPARVPALHPPEARVTSARINLTFRTLDPAP